MIPRRRQSDGGFIDRSIVATHHDRRSMFRPVLPAALLGLSVPAALAVMAGPSTPADAQLVIHERITIRVPRIPAAISRPAPVASRWKEKKGPACLDIREVAGAVIAVPASVDLLLGDGRWMRARLDGDCRSADFYTGLYIRPGPDGRLCADRDAIRIRSGAKCAIDAFKLLVARR
jgi:hypothetical protein